MERVVVTFFFVVIVGVVGVGDVVIGGNLYRQLRAERFATTQGLVTHSDVYYRSGSKGGSRGVDVRYSYVVGGRRFAGANYRYGDYSSRDGGWRFTRRAPERLPHRLP